MRNWFFKNLGDAMLATEPLDQIKAAFLSDYEKAGRPADMAVFTRHESEGRLHCEVKVYLSPASISVARAINAIPCERPAPDNLSLLAGTDNCWTALFHERSG